MCIYHLNDYYYCIECIGSKKLVGLDRGTLVILSSYTLFKQLHETKGESLDMKKCEERPESSITLIIPLKIKKKFVWLHLHQFIIIH